MGKWNESVEDNSSFFVNYSEFLTPLPGLGQNGEGTTTTTTPVLFFGGDPVDLEVSNLTAVVVNRSSSIPGNGSGVEQDESGELYQVPVSIIVLLALLYGGISAAALIGNLLVLWVVSISRRMRTVTNMFIANLAFADIIIGLFTIPFQFQAALLQRWNLPDFMCAFCPFVQVLSVNISVFTLSAIALDRYRAVLFPLSARASKRKATWVILSIWSVGLILALPTELDYKVIEIEQKGKMKPFCTNMGLSTTFRVYYTLGLVVIQYFFPLIIISGAYAHMATKLWGTTAPGNKEESRDAVVLRNKKKVIKMLALVVLLFALCWLPLQMYNFLQTLIPSINMYQYINIIWFCSHWLAMSNSCCNPFIYAIYNDKFQREFKSRLWCARVCGRRNSDTLATTYSEASDFDRTKVRASYRFTNSRSVRYNHHSVYKNSNERERELRRNSSCRSSFGRQKPTNRNPLNRSPVVGNRLAANYPDEIGIEEKLMPNVGETCLSTETRENGFGERIGSSSNLNNGTVLAVITTECGKQNQNCQNVKTMTVVANNAHFKL